MGNPVPNPAFQATVDALLQQIDDLKAQISGNEQKPTPPAPPAGSDRAEFNVDGELHHMAKMVLMHLWGHTELSHIYGCTPDSVPNIDHLCEEDMAVQCFRHMANVGEIVGALPQKIQCHKKLAFNRSQVDVFIACHHSMLHHMCTSDVLNSLLYMGELGQFLAQELFSASVGELMAADTEDAPNATRKKALNLIGSRIKEAFIPAGVLAPLEQKQLPVITNPLRGKDKACTAYGPGIDLFPSQSKLPF